MERFDRDLDTRLASFEPGAPMPALPAAAFSAPAFLAPAGRFASVDRFATR